MTSTAPYWGTGPMASHQMQSTGAFTSVATRRNFGQNHVSATPPPSTLPAAQQASNPSAAAAKAKRDWPESVRLYVQRAFASENNIPGINREELETKLKQVISDSAESNTLLTVDWANKPLPQHMISDERHQTIYFNQNPPWGNGVAPLNIHDTNTRSTDSPSKKRKSSDLESSQNGHQKVPPWHLANNRVVFEDRITHPDKRQRTDFGGKSSSKSHQAKNKKRFEDGLAGYVSPKQPFTPSQRSTPPHEMDQGPVIGRCQDLEKKYFRLTSAPNPDTVRPLPVLERTLDLLKRKWKKENNYSYLCDQFKSLRQDLTVQHIKTEFTVDVYEIHARIALERGDLGEYNQCQTQLRALHSQHLGGHPEEFKAYRILYFIHTCNRTDMNNALADLTPEEKKVPAIKHALETRSALALGNHHRFAQLYLSTPNMGAYLMDMFVGRERLAALSNMCLSYKPAIKLRFFTEELGFESDDESARFICDHGGQAFLEDREGEVMILTSKAGRFFEATRQAAFQKVDIKGQI
ncbi:hypothetical protein ABVK25_009211 [Lepraria finkii]|uniref:SAC3/GANP/THP3 conserved domain-containing protein n=1 Tax=Lepraria finkii TaxID=1340010 RepID=A0ABR4AY04_9LECA